MFFFGIKNIIKLVILAPFIVVAVLVVNKFVGSTEAFAPEIKEIKDIQICEINKEKILINITAMAKNKNSLALLLNNINLNIFLKNDSLGTAFGKADVNIPSDSTSEIKLIVEIATKKLAQILSDGSDTLVFNFKGQLNAKMSAINIPVDIDIPIKINLRELFINVLENDADNDEIIKINKAELVDITLNKSKIRINFSFRNPYGIEFKLLGYPSKIIINGKYAGRGNIESALVFGNKSNEATGNLIFNLDNFDSGTSLLNALLSKKLDYETEGELLIDMFGYSINLPFSFKGDLLE
ncbi:MAG: hypothetical protein V1773_02500 [bacterium]